MFDFAFRETIFCSSGRNRTVFIQEEKFSSQRNRHVVRLPSKSSRKSASFDRRNERKTRRENSRFVVASFRSIEILCSTFKDLRCRMQSKKDLLKQLKEELVQLDDLQVKKISFGICRWKVFFRIDNEGSSNKTKRRTSSTERRNRPSSQGTSSTNRTNENRRRKSTRTTTNRTRKANRTHRKTSWPSCFSSFRCLQFPRKELFVFRKLCSSSTINRSKFTRKTWLWRDFYSFW